MTKADGRRVERAAGWVAAVAAATSLGVSVPQARADSPVELMNVTIECHIGVKSVPSATCRKVTKFPDKSIEFVIQGDLNTDEPVKFRNPTAKCTLGWFDEKLSCYQHPTYVNHQASTWRVILEGDKGYLIHNIGADCYLYIDPTGVTCAPGRPDPIDATFYWRLLG